MYNYNEEVTKDVLQWIKDNMTVEEIREQLADEDSFCSYLNDELWAEDSVTGNASGSYTFSTYKAGEYLAGNFSLLAEALHEFCEEDMNAIDRGEEFCDVTIRCYVLPYCIRQAVEYMCEGL